MTARTHAPTDALDEAADRAFRLSVPALAGCTALLLLAILASVTQGAAGLPVEGVVRALVGALPGVDLAEAGLRQH